jgi:hypothetical protein
MSICRFIWPLLLMPSSVCGCIWPLLFSLSFSDKEGQGIYWGALQQLFKVKSQPADWKKVKVYTVGYIFFHETKYRGVQVRLNFVNLKWVTFWPWKERVWMTSVRVAYNCNLVFSVNWHKSMTSHSSGTTVARFWHFAVKRGQVLADHKNGVRLAPLKEKP